VPDPETRWVARAAESRSPAAQQLWPGLALAAGAVVFVVVLARPALDGTWENHAAHFWLVLIAAALNVTLGYTVGAAAGGAVLALSGFGTLGFG
jgi:hypothetical protein